MTSRQPRPLPGHLFVTLSLIPANGEWIDEAELVEKASAHPGGTVLDRQGRIDGIRDLRRHGFTCEQRSSDESPVLYTRTPKGSGALGARARKGSRP